MSQLEREYDASYPPSTPANWPPVTPVDIAKELREARQLKADRDKILAAGRRRGTKRRHVVVSFTLDELAEAVGVSKRTLQWWRKTRRVDLADRAAVVALLRQGDAVKRDRQRCGT